MQSVWENFQSAWTMNEFDAFILWGNKAFNLLLPLFILLVAAITLKPIRGEANNIIYRHYLAIKCDCNGCINYNMTKSSRKKVLVSKSPALNLICLIRSGWVDHAGIAVSLL